LQKDDSPLYDDELEKNPHLICE